MAKVPGKGACRGAPLAGAPSYSENTGAMFVIICNPGQRAFFEKLVSAAGYGQTGSAPLFVCDEEQFRSTFSSPRPEGDLVILETSLRWGGRLSQNFYGIDVAAAARRFHSLKCPVVFFSPLPESYFKKQGRPHEKFSLLHAHGSVLLSFPFSVATLRNSLFGMSPLSDAELRDVVINHCGLRAEWRAAAHQFENALRDYPRARAEAGARLSAWADSVGRYAPEQGEKLDILKELLGKPPAEVTEDELRAALQSLDAGLQGRPAEGGDEKLAATAPTFPKAPPEYHSKIMVADDEDRSFLISSLRHDYRYEVLDQAMTPERARSLLDEQRPEVVLADWHFREAEQGVEFIKYALRRKFPPLILVTSKASLRDDELREAGLPEDVINCSGPRDSANPATIHRKIWLGANRDNVFHPAESYPEQVRATLAQTCRERLGRYAVIISSHAERWRGFARILRYTINQARLILPAASGDDEHLVRRIVEILEPHETSDEFTLPAIAGLVEMVEKTHEDARLPPHTQAKQILRGLLHGKIEQFSGILGEIDSILEQVNEVIADLRSLTAHRDAAVKVQAALSECRRGSPAKHQYARLGEVLAEVCASLPAPTTAPERKEKTRAPLGERIRLVVVEDDAHWQNVVREAVGEVRARLVGSDVVIDAQYFDNADEALKAIPKPRKEREIVGPLLADKTIVISDICLPEDRPHADRINAALAGARDELAVPRRSHGLKLIQELRSYSYNIPVIVFSTVDEIGDRLAVGELGVPDINYISKGVDDYSAIVRALVRQIEKKSKHRLEKIEAAERTVFRIDGVEIQFTREEESTFDALFGIHQLKESARREGRIKYGQVGVSVDEILDRLELPAEDQNRKNIQKEFRNIRKSIFESFRRARRYISTHEVIKSIRRHGGDFAYEIVAEIPTFEEEAQLGKGRGEPCKVLVVEDNPEYLRQIETLLGKLGYETGSATNVEDALATAERFSPDILCLEMDLPVSRADNGREPPGCAEGAGLTALEQIQAFLHDVRAAFLTNTHNANRLIGKAVQLGVTPLDFVDKSRTNWLPWLAAVVGKHRRDITHAEAVTVPFASDLPLVEVLAGSNLENGVLNLRVNGRHFETRKSRKVEDAREADVVYRILGCLLSNPDMTIPESQIEAMVGKKATADMWKNWRKRLRAIIREWIQIKKSDHGSKEGDLSHRILESKKMHLTLRVNVVRSDTHG